MGQFFSGFEQSNIFLSGDFFKDPGNVAQKGDRFKTTEDYEINNGEYLTNFHVRFNSTKEYITQLCFNTNNGNNTSFSKII